MNADLGRVNNPNICLLLLFVLPLKLPYSEQDLLPDLILISYSLLVKINNYFLPLFCLGDSFPFLSLHTGQQATPLFSYWELFRHPAKRVSSVDAFLPLAALLLEIEWLFTFMIPNFGLSWLRHRLENAVIYLVNCFCQFLFQFLLLF